MFGPAEPVFCSIATQAPRIVADRARRKALEDLDDALRGARREARGEEDTPQIDAVKATIDEVKAIRQGAYSSISEGFP